MKNRNFLKKTLSALFCAILIIFTGTVFALIPDTEPCWVKGTVKGTNFQIDGVTIGAYLGDTLLKSHVLQDNGNNTADLSLNSVGAKTGQTISIKVHGVTFETFTFQGFCKTNDDPWIVLDEITVSKQENGANGCTSNSICLSGLCVNGACVSPTPTPTATPTPTPGPGGGSTGGSGTTGGTSGGGGRTPTPMPTATPTPTPKTKTETVFKETQKYLPSPEEVDNTIVEAGVTSPREIARIIEQMDYLSIEKTLEVKKTTDVATGEESFESTITILITNTGDNAFENGTAYELIPKSLVSDPGFISSDLPFTIEEKGDFLVIKWNYGRLGPGKTAQFSYRLPFSIGIEILKNSKSLFSGDKRVALPEELLGKIIVKVSFTGVPQQGIIVSLVKDDVKEAQGATNAHGTVEFGSLPAGAYVVSTQATDKFNAASIVVGLMAGETKTPEIRLSAKTIGPGEEKFELPWAFIAIIAIVLVLLAIFLFGDKLFGEKEAVGLAAAAKKTEPKRPFKKEAPKEEKPETKPIAPIAKEAKKPEPVKKEEPKRPLQKAKEAREAAAAAAVKPEPKPAEPEEPKTYKCEECGEEFHTRIALRAHKRRHQHTR